MGFLGFFRAAAPIRDAQALADFIDQHAAFLMQLRASEYPTIRNYLRVTLCNIHDEFTKRLDAAAVVAALRGD